MTKTTPAPAPATTSEPMSEPTSDVEPAPIVKRPPQKMRLLTLDPKTKNFHELARISREFEAAKAKESKP